MTNTSNEIDSRDPRWNHLFDKTMPVPEGYHVIGRRWGQNYMFELVEGDSTVQMVYVHPERFYYAKYMVRAAVKKLVYMNMPWKDQLKLYEENRRRLEEELGF